MARINYEESEKYQQSQSDWFQLKDHGDCARVQFLFDDMNGLDIFACHTVKVGDKDRYVDCLRKYDDPIDMCPLCASGFPVKPVRFVTMYQHDDQKVKIWERGKQFITKVQGLMARYSPLSNFVFEIERFGAKGSKETKYDIFPMQNIDPVDLSQVEKPELLGGLILDKNAQEMEVYLQTGNFPQVQENAPATNVPARRGASQAPASQPATRAGSRAGAPTSRASRATNQEVF